MGGERTEHFNSICLYIPAPATLSQLIKAGISARTRWRHRCVKKYVYMFNLTLTMMTATTKAARPIRWSFSENSSISLSWQLCEETEAEWRCWPCPTCFGQLTINLWKFPCKIWAWRYITSHTVQYTYPPSINEHGDSNSFSLNIPSLNSTVELVSRPTVFA